MPPLRMCFALVRQCFLQESVLDFVRGGMQVLFNHCSLKKTNIFPCIHCSVLVGDSDRIFVSDTTECRNLEERASKSCENEAADPGKTDSQGPCRGGQSRNRQRGVPSWTDS